MSDRQGNANYSDYNDSGVNMNPDDIPLEPRKGSFAYDAWVVIRRLRIRGITVPELVEKIKAEKVRTSDTLPTMKSCKSAIHHLCHLGLIESQPRKRNLDPKSRVTWSVYLPVLPEDRPIRPGYDEVRFIVLGLWARMDLEAELKTEANAERRRQIRIRLNGLTRTNLALRAGVSPEAVRQIENGGFPEWERRVAREVRQ